MRASAQRSIEFSVSLALTGGLLAIAAFYKPQVDPPQVSKPARVPTDRYYGITSAGHATWVVGDGGKVLHSTDGGETWAVQRGYGHPALQAIAAWDAMRIVAVGNDNQIIRTEDGGRNWLSVPDVPRSNWNNKLLQIHLGDDGKAWAVGAGGAVLRSADFGESWQPMVEMEDITWHGVSSCDHGNQLVVVGEFGNILTSSDAGKTWTAAPSPTDITLTAVGLDSACQGLAVGLQGTVLRLLSGRWQPIETPEMGDAASPVHWFAIAGADHRWWITGEYGVLMQVDLPESTAGTMQIRLIESVPRAAWLTDLQPIDNNLLVVGATIAKATPDIPSLISRR
ncbi:MAG: hypothetical protein SV583_07785 [Pseudomonadota bacterium]|nr:hypothetical protein [Pseudomonadota bacterium]